MRRWGIAVSVFLIASTILVVSILRSAAVRYAFKAVPTPAPQGTTDEKVPYPLPYTGKVTPDHVLWPLKVMRDKAWIFVTTNPLKRAEIALLLSDKRIAAADKLVKEGNLNLALSVADKAEMYLFESWEDTTKARNMGMETLTISERIALSSLKHREVLERIRTQSPEEAKGILTQLIESAKMVNEKSSQSLSERGKKPPSNPFFY